MSSLWQRVVSRVTPALSAAPLALVGMAGWISGDGALLNCAGEELSASAPALLDGAAAGPDQRAGHPAETLADAWVVRCTPTCGGSSRGWPGEVACR